MGNINDRLPSSIPGLHVTCGMSLPGSLPCSEGFLSGSSGFPVFLKNQYSTIELDSVGFQLICMVSPITARQHFTVTT